MSVPDIQAKPAASMSDEDIVTRVLRGEHPLFELLMRRHNERLYRVARGILRDDTEAQDVMQQAYVAAFTHLAQFKGEARFSTWLTRIAIREATARTRRKSLHLVETDMEAQVAHTASPEEELMGRELTGIVESIVDALPEPYRIVFMLRAVQELSVTETAECLDVSEEVVKVRLHRARIQIRDAVEKKLGHGASATFQFHRGRCDQVVRAVFDELHQKALVPGDRNDG